ncbi:hypothetical protein BBG47_27350 [Paenibacillus sp. KS1]|uniref:hypothetical protein n=1 Tax=Paenibacillus sp. KS1 TaxID=1849249 RepID=UPI0008064D38|nr:hypothetical protein [Paenibacillus sp. KS1]OBY76397.1 hypothetical protein BBG47_27350 [Paenibacillus sp. KS1]
MKRNIFLFSTLIIMISFISFVRTDTATGISSDTPKVKDLYSYYYSTKSISILEGLDSDSALLSDVEHDDVRKIINDGIYEVWLYVNSVDIRNIDSTDKLQILNYINSLHSNKGFFKANLKDSSDRPNSSYLLDTKMALEIYDRFERDIPNTKKILNYIESTLNQINSPQTYDFVSLGGYLTIINQIETILARYINLNQDELYSNSMIGRLKKLYLEEPSSIEKFETAVNINNYTNTLILPIDTKEVETYIKRIQNKNGMFPISGSKTGFDTLSTFLVIKTLTTLGIEIPNKEKLLSSLKQIQSSTTHQYQ